MHLHGHATRIGNCLPTNEFARQDLAGIRSLCRCIKFAPGAARLATTHETLPMQPPSLREHGLLWLFTDILYSGVCKVQLTAVGDWTRHVHGRQLVLYYISRGTDFLLWWTHKSYLICVRFGWPYLRETRLKEEGLTSLIPAQDVGTVTIAHYRGETWLLIVVKSWLLLLRWFKKWIMRLVRSLEWFKSEIWKVT